MPGFLSWIFLMLLSACSADRHPTAPVEHSNPPPAERNFKGILATQDPEHRGTISLKWPGEEALLEDPNRLKAILRLENGIEKEIWATAISPETDFRVLFESEDLSFTFSLDQNGEPLITEVIYKNQPGSLIVAEEFEGSPVTPVTGTYKCTNCQDQDAAINGIVLNNEPRTFNMLFSSQDGQRKISLQSLMDQLVSTELILTENCSTQDPFTICEFRNNEEKTTEPVSLSGLHRYSLDESGNNTCGTIAGNFEFQLPGYGLIKGVFTSDSTCLGTTYYISPDGNDENSGTTPSQAWKSIDRINSIALEPGTQLLFEGNQQYKGTLYFDENDAGNSARPIRISSFGSGKATIFAGEQYGIYAYNTAGIIIDRLIVEGSGSKTNASSGILFYNELPGNQKLDLVTITNTEVYGFRDYGIGVGAWNGNSGFSNVLLENNKVHDILDVGIGSYGYFSSSKTGYSHKNITVRGCEVFNVNGYSRNKHSGNGIVLSDVQGSTIEHCTVHDCGSGNTHCGGPVGIWFWDSDQVTIAFCEVFNMRSGTGCDGGGFDLDGGVTNGIMQYNYSHDNDGAGFMAGQFMGARPMENIIIRYNISENDASTNGGSIGLFNGEEFSSMSNILVYHNTLFLREEPSNLAAATIKFSSWKPLGEQIFFYNNILVAENGADLLDLPPGYKAHFFGNLYFSPDDFGINYQGELYGSLEEFRKTGNEVLEGRPVGYQETPGLSDPGNGGTIGHGNSLSDLQAYKLLIGSPAIDSGLDLPAEKGYRDFFGNNLLSGSSNDIGAHEKK